jgi:hypothetical protein
MIDAFWMPEGNLGVRLAGVPLEEVVWGFAAALFSGPVFRACSTPSASVESTPSRARSPAVAWTSRSPIPASGRQPAGASELDS